MPRVLGVDLGTRRIGLALTDPLGVTAAPHAVLVRAASKRDDHDAIVRAAREADADRIVVGLPRSLDGRLGPSGRRVLSEVGELRRRAGGLAVEVHDERFSTVTAEAALVEGGVRRRERRGRVDAVAAAVILQSWLDARRTGGREGGGAG